MAGREKDRKIFYILFALILVVCVNAPVFNGAGLTRFTVGHDAAIKVQAAARAAAGKGFNGVNIDSREDMPRDLSEFGYRFHVTQPPAVTWLMYLFIKSGLTPESAYKLLCAMLLVVGVVAWMYFAGSYLSGYGYVFFCLLLVIFQASGWVKPSDIFIWAFMPVYLGLILRGGVGRAAAAGLIGAVFIVFWYGAVYIAIAGAACVYIFSKGSFGKRAVAAAGFVVPCVVAYALIKVYVSRMSGGAVLDYAVPGFYLSQLPLKHFLTGVPAFFGDFIGFSSVYGMVKGLVPFGLGNYVGFFLPAACMSLLAIVVSRGWRAGKERRNLLPAAAMHFIILYCLLVWMSVRYRYGDPEPADVNVLMQADRYMKHLVPAITIAWIAAVSGWMRNSGTGAGKIAVAAYVILITVFTPAVLIRDILSAGRVARSKMAAEFIKKDIAIRPGGPHKVFDLRDTDYLTSGDVNAYRLYYTEDDYGKLSNSGKIYIYVVVRHGLKATNWIRDPGRVENDARMMARRLSLKKLAGFDGDETEVFGGEVGPFEEGRYDNRDSDDKRHAD
ncbi:MAG TPA: hypothetical protein PLN69_08545 [bacterium]|nr:hypothetical protein [bacterium]